LHRSDREGQYTSDEFQRLMIDHGVTCSMSRSGNVWDNAAMESFFSSLKTERTARKVYRSRDEAKADVFDYLERFSNTKRRHSTIGYVSPMEFEMQAGFAYPGVIRTGRWGNWRPVIVIWQVGVLRFRLMVETRSAIRGLKHQMEKRSMEHYAGMDVSIKETSICIVDDTGKVVREVKVASEPDMLMEELARAIYRFKRIGVEAGPLSQWLYNALTDAGLPIICSRPVTSRPC